MKLTYRGATYEYNPTPVVVTDNEIAGKYRGANVRFHNFRLLNLFQPTFDLIYRGAHFTAIG